MWRSAWPVALWPFSFSTTSSSSGGLPASLLSLSGSCWWKGWKGRCEPKTCRNMPMCRRSLYVGLGRDLSCSFNAARLHEANTPMAYSDYLEVHGTDSPI